MITTADVTILSLLLLLSTASAQPPAPPPPYTFNPSVATIIVIVLAGVFFIGFFSLYLRLCSGSSSASLNPLLAATSLRRRNPGLDANTVASFPVFHYSEVKELKIGKNTLECAICLNEFEDDETLRLIPNCDHVFHPECIDAWLASHVTCPVCRANLVPGPEKPEVSPTGESISVRVVPREVDTEPEPVYAHALDQSPCAEAQEQGLARRTRLFGKFTSSLQRGDPAQASLVRRTGFFGKFPRSHSTGHSLVVVHPGENTERFTLRFPDHLRKEVMTRALIRTATFNITEGSSRRSRRGGEGGSSRGARSYKRLDRAVKSDRWVITVPFFTSGKLMLGDGEGSTGRGKVTAVKLPSFKCLEPTTSGDVDNEGSGRSAV